ncbi:hypothetical protein GCM10027169_12810 [Gordonia jinhuaensis]|uniref:Uncharacterized protein n=1 Tax=Gordonia jinhuaensis TaxID=1517702 RepID=A0A916SZZ4_9ACTN|nr:hypothetical protein GCM10011489_08150 [Gordonia jinhuaensis]
MQIVIRECPVCWRLVETAQNVWAHNDKAGNVCPMSGKEAPRKWCRGTRAIPWERGEVA